ncbi:MAG: mycofactocin-coupled SDR family oxidoreductase [Mycolicibacterium cosmeticum]|nr:mycofactocin-coupled SDR family oxidoreductase [Mycolicibacterium cosmeticum]
MTGRVEGKVAFVTGAARGQGRSHAVKLAQEGADIIAIDICAPIENTTAPAATPEDLAETADLIKALDRRVVTAEVDVRDYGAIKAAVDSGVEQLGRLDVVVANAGIGTPGAMLDEMDEPRWEQMMDINLTGVWKSVKAAVPHLKTGGRGGSVVLTSSVGGLKAYPHIGHYVTAKHGVVGLMRTFAVELGPHSIRVNSVHPTHVATPLLHNESTFRAFRPDLENPTKEDLEPICRNFHYLPIPWIEAEDVSNAVLFLASDESRYVTGVPLPVDAGCCLK